ncbi:hypothetical protein BJP36_40730 [Moorena producens JHB]|uniref:Uncharacterized protein n=1 Tax=Moorena producens (strain JHB) TaxID=1454205 RepID=A0A9Q9SS76_MOOP1|nr:hypothetical protein [Moorena producens]WAN68694.1 hypothetical protein BJP36_40730 [Moorena producens JHB]
MQQRLVKGEDGYQTLVLIHWPFGLLATLRERPRYANALSSKPQPLTKGGNPNGFQ